MLQPVPKSNKEQKNISRQVNLAIISPRVSREYLHWSEQPIEFNRKDHPITVPRPGNAPVVLKTKIGGYGVERVCMDTGSRINLIYAKTLQAMSISLEFPQANKLFFPWNRTWKRKLPIGLNSTQHLLR
jgi:hypothetical protein